LRAGLVICRTSMSDPFALRLDVMLILRAN
jgi:hypothetical protein